MAMCIYNNCSSVQKPFSSLAFFALPKDARRKLWIENSGNTQLATLSESARRVVCEKHFSPNVLRKQFHRTILSRDAVPEKWSVEQIQICENPPDETHLKEENLITIDEQSDDEEEANKEVEDWQSEYETSLVDQAEDVILDFEVDNSASASSPDIEGHFAAHEDAATQDIINEKDHNHQLNEEESTLLEILIRDSPSPNQYPPFLDEVEIETVSPEKRKIIDDDGRSLKFPKISNKQPQEELRTSVQSENFAYDVMVSSSTTKSDDSSGSLQGVNEEDKYFALALVGILQRISPQKRAFAKVNILKYLTELEYGVEASIK